MHDILKKINADKREHIERCKAKTPLAHIKSKLADMPHQPRGFHSALQKKAENGEIALIAEIKKASPSKGLIRADFDPPELAKAYLQGGAAALSVLTDTPYFQGCNDDLQRVRASSPLPLLRKDFMLDIYQIYEAALIGADCVLLILAALEKAQAQELEQAAHELGLDVLLEVHGEDELAQALSLQSPLIGVNNRNLKTLKMDLSIGQTLLPQIPQNRFAISESGLYSHDDILTMQKFGAKAFLIGESLMRQDDVCLATRNILGKT